MLITANNPHLRSWVTIPENSDFPIQNLPFGVFISPTMNEPHLCTAIGNYVADLSVLHDLAFFHDLDIDEKIFKNRWLNDFIALGRATTRAVRNRLSAIFDADNAYMDAQRLSEYYLFPMNEVSMLLPVEIGDYTDFFSSKEHATNTGMMFRDPANALLPNWLHIPVGYHGRSSSIVVSGTPLHRPMGQTLPPDSQTPVFGASQRVDFELEVAFVVGKKSQLGQRITTDEAEDYIFGLTVFNDWSARDIQQWEYVPLGPFLGKNFGSTLSPWIVTMDAMEPFRVAGPVQDPTPLPYLHFEGNKSYDMNLSVAIQPEGQAAHTVAISNFKYMYWNMCQQLAHHTVNGCNMRVGDLCASGTISGPTPDSYGSMLELAWKGTKPIAMPDGSTRKFINDNDTVIMKAWCEKDGVRIGFGEASGKILAAIA